MTTPRQSILNALQNAAAAGLGDSRTADLILRGLESAGFVVSDGASEMALDVIARLRAAGWRVAVHNDYRQGGEDWTFWLFTHPDGRWVKGEGRNDFQATTLAMIAAAKETP